MFLQRTLARALRTFVDPRLFAITQAFCNSAKLELLNGIHAFGTTVVRAATTADTFNLALFPSSATLGATTTTYSNTGECPASGNYTQGGKPLVIASGFPKNATGDATKAIVDFDDLSWTSSTITARGGLIYNDTQGDKAFAVLDFGSDKQSSNGTFTVVFPDASGDGSTAIIRLT